MATALEKAATLVRDYARPLTDAEHPVSTKKTVKVGWDLDVLADRIEKLRDDPPADPGQRRRCHQCRVRKDGVRLYRSLNAYVCNDCWFSINPPGGDDRELPSAAPAGV